MVGNAEERMGAGCEPVRDLGSARRNTGYAPVLPCCSKFRGRGGRVDTRCSFSAIMRRCWQERLGCPPITRPPLPEQAPGSIVPAEGRNIPFRHAGMVGVFALGEGNNQEQEPDSSRRYDVDGRFIFSLRRETVHRSAPLHPRMNNLPQRRGWLSAAFNSWR